MHPVLDLAGGVLELRGGVLELRGSKETAQ